MCHSEKKNSANNDKTIHGRARARTRGILACGSDTHETNKQRVRGCEATFTSMPCDFDWRLVERRGSLVIERTDVAYLVGFRRFLLFDLMRLLRVV